VISRSKIVRARRVRLAERITRQRGAQWDVSPIFWPKMAKIKVKVRNV